MSTSKKKPFLLLSLSLMAGVSFFEKSYGSSPETSQKEASTPATPRALTQEEEALIRSIEEEMEDQAEKKERTPLPKALKHPWKFARQIVNQSGETLKEYTHPTKGKIIVTMEEKGEGFFKYLKEKGDSAAGTIKNSKVYRGITNTLTPRETLKALKFWGNMVGDKDTKPVTIEDLVENGLIRRRDLAFKKELIRLAKEKEIDLNEPNEMGEPALLIAVRNGDLTMVQALLENDVDLRNQDKGGNTALHEAAKKGDLPILEALLEEDVSTLDEINATGFTPLHLAVLHKNSQAVEKLLEKGADPDMKISSLQNVTARSLARKNPQLAQVFKKYE